MYLKLGAFVSQLDNFGIRNIEKKTLVKKMVVTLHAVKEINNCVYVCGTSTEFSLR